MNALIPMAGLLAYNTESTWKMVDCAADEAWPEVGLFNMWTMLYRPFPTPMVEALDILREDMRDGR